MPFSNMYSWLYHIMQKLTVEEYDKRLPMHQHLPTTGSHLQEPYYHIIACMEIHQIVQNFCRQIFGHGHLLTVLHYKNLH